MCIRDRHKLDITSGAYIGEIFSLFSLNLTMLLLSSIKSNSFSVVDSNSSITAVSYTHLDVYKRQLLMHPYV